MNKIEIRDIIDRINKFKIFFEKIDNVDKILEN